jgi:hypothetical protein
MQGRYAATREERIEWLLKNQKLWERFGVQFFTPQEQTDRMRVLIDTMVSADLYSKKTYRGDISRGLLILISEARKLRAQRARNRTTS